MATDISSPSSVYNGQPFPSAPAQAWIRGCRFWGPSLEPARSPLPEGGTRVSPRRVFEAEEGRGGHGIIGSASVWLPGQYRNAGKGPTLETKETSCKVGFSLSLCAA